MTPKKFGALACAAVVGGLIMTACAPSQDRREFRGVLRTDIAAIGGETTGVILETDERDYELQFAPQEEEMAELLAGERVVVRGELVEREGVEIPVRHIIEVSEIRPE